MKNTRDILITLIISAVVLVIGVALLERHYRNELIKLGWLPKTQLNKYPYGRKLSGYTVSQNTPNYAFTAYNNKLQPTSAQTDSNGFLTGGATVQKTKESGTVRIFITGGSAAWGSLESRALMHDTTYPEGSYCYSATIAGKLQALLQAKYPQRKFEVIDAAVVMFRFHQSMALYFEKLHDFNPDIIINMDGYNDEGDFLTYDDNKDPYVRSADQLEEMIQLETMARLPMWGYTLAYYNFKNIRAHDTPRYEKRAKVHSDAGNNAPLNHQPDYASYQAMRGFTSISKKMRWLITSYQRQLRADGVYSIFCLQPTLQRRVYQKNLTTTELRLRSFLEKVTAADTLKMLRKFDEQRQLNTLTNTVWNKIGVDKYYREILKRQYTYNEISPLLDSISTANGAGYVDVNKALTGLGADKEFYTDYCHLTPLGNEFVAGLLLSKVEDYMKKH